MNSTTGQELHNPGADQAPDGPDMDVPWYKRKFYRAVGGVAALLLAGGAVIGVANANKGDGDSDPNPVPTASAPEIPGETIRPTVTPTGETDPTEIPIEQQVMPEDLKQYEIMTSTQFEQLPVDERQTYPSWLMRDKQEISDLFVRGLGGDSTFALPDSVSPNNTAQEASNVFEYYFINAVTSHFNVNGIDGKSVLYDQDTAIKILSAGFADTTSQAYLDARQGLIDTFKDSVIRNEGVSGQASHHNLTVSLVTSDLGSTTSTGNGTGENVILHGMDNTSIHADGTHWEGSSTLQYVEFTNYKDVEEGTWVFYGEPAPAN